ncbi:hypothetical protein Q7C36_014771 [Tachysurus vachellii]|uniref:Ig-like domain-containing protein n=1 Tax=Tachysurus vachellii TaxID=175792 RepID=A0AA88MDD2_TACVA|nr:hypothetical protein Q7C36_014771 [Tachysurus vachellii]
MSPKLIRQQRPRPVGMQTGKNKTYSSHYYSITSVRQKTEMMLCIFLSLLLGQCVLRSAQSDVFVQRIAAGSEITVSCENEGRVSWSKQADGKRDVIFKASNEDPEQVKPSDPRYKLLSNLSLVITDTLLSDSGLYYCNATPVVNLQVTQVKGISTDLDTTISAPGGVSGIEQGLPVFLAALFLFLFTVE